MGINNMSKQSSQPVSINTGEIRIKGHGSYALANQQANSITNGLKNAIQNISINNGLNKNIHLNQLKVRIPQNANQHQITSLLEQALENSLQITGGQHG